MHRLGDEKRFGSSKSISSLLLSSRIFVNYWKLFQTIFSKSLGSPI
jgi:hypothetical protein